jgi:hypothetical protein
VPAFIHSAGRDLRQPDPHDGGAALSIRLDCRAADWPWSLSDVDVVVEGSNFLAQREAAMYLVIRKFNHISSMAEAARRAESGLGQLLKQSPGFQAYYVFDAGNGAGGSVSLFESKEAALAANEKALAWIRGSLIDVINGEPEITMGEVLVVVSA